MESSEDDAGNATSASCRASAREKDVGLVENDDPTSDTQLEPLKASASVRTPTMSEDNFDGDSIPSPSAQDVNTSTEAILDMIDEFVDGPGAPKRLPLPIDNDRLLEEAFDSISDTETKQPNVVVKRHPTPPPSCSNKVEISDESFSVKSPVCEPLNDSIDVNTSSSITSPQKSPVCVDITEKSSNQEETENNCAVINTEPETLSVQIVTDSPSSSIQNVQNTTKNSVCDESKQSNRTLKCVTSSDNRDCVTVERAESTSSECSVSESKDISVEASSKLPLKRRLVRPGPGDKRPDSTVSSTVDSQTRIVQPSPSTTCDVIVKDVSSSSDAVTLQHSNDKPDEISNVSEINICKAETSTSPRKIRLVRPKVNPALSVGSQAVVTPEKEQCQSTSSDEHVAPVFTVTHTSTLVDGAQKESLDTKTDSQIPNVMVNSIPSKSSTSIDKQSRALTGGSSLTTEKITHADNSKEPELASKSEPDNIQSDQLIKSLEIHSSEQISAKSTKLIHPTATEQKETKPIEPQSENDISKQSETIESGLSQVVPIETEKPQQVTDLTQELKDVTSKVFNITDISTITETSASEASTENTKTEQSHLNSLSKVPIHSEDTVNVLEQALTTDQSVKVETPLKNTYIDIQISDSDEKLQQTSEVLPESEKINELTVQHEKNKSLEVVSVLPLPNSLEKLGKQSESNIQSHSTVVNDVESSSVSLSKDSHHAKPMEVDTITKKADLRKNEPGTEDISGVQSIEVEKKLPPIKLTLMKVSKPEKKTNDLSISKKDNSSDTSIPQKTELLKVDTNMACDSSTKNDVSEIHVDQKKVPPIKLSLSSTDHNSCLLSPQKNNAIDTDSESTKQVPKLTIKIGNKHSEEMKSPVPKLTIKPILPPPDQNIEDKLENNQQIPNVTKLNIKPIVKPIAGTESQSSKNVNDGKVEHTPSITKLNIKPIPKPAERINDMHRKSSSSEISESEYSENDETSTSDQASASEQGLSDTVPKVTIKLGRPGTESEGKFYTEKNIPKLTIKGIQQNENDEKDAKLKLVITQSEDTMVEKVPKLTIKTKTKIENQPLSPKLTIKPIKAENEIPKLKITSDMLAPSSDIKENMHVPKITIKAVPVSESDAGTRTPKKSTQLICDSSDHIPTVTKLNIKPVVKPSESGESSEDMVDKVPVVSKLNIKPIVKPIDNEVDSSIENVPKIKKINIKPLINPEENSSEEKDCDEIVDDKDKSIPVVTKLNIKPIVKPEEDDALKDSENQSSETGTSSDDNSDHIPIVTKLNIKPILKPGDTEEMVKDVPGEQIIPVITKLNIKPIIKPDDHCLPQSPKKDSLKSPGSSSIPTVTKLNIKPLVKPEGINENRSQDEGDKSKNPPLVMKINMKNVCENLSDQKYNNNLDGTKSPRQPMSPKIKKSNLTPDRDQPRRNLDTRPESPNLQAAVSFTNCLSQISEKTKENQCSTEQNTSYKSTLQVNEIHDRKSEQQTNASPVSPGTTRQKKSLQNCTLLKQLLSNTKDDAEKSRDMSISNCIPHSDKSDSPIVNCNTTTSIRGLFDGVKSHNSDLSTELTNKGQEVGNESRSSKVPVKMRTIQELRKEVNESVTKPLEIITDKISNQSSGQDSPRIILKINKTDHGPSAKIITEEVHKHVDSPPQNHIDNTHEPEISEKPSPKKHYNTAARKLLAAEEAKSLTLGKRLRSSRVVDTPEKSPPAVKRTAGKRTSVSETSPNSNKESDLSIDPKRLKLEQLLSVNTGLTITPVAPNCTQTSPKPKTENKQTELKNHTLVNNDNSKNGNSKLHNILSNLQAKQMQTLQLSETSITKETILPDAESNTSTGSSEVIVEISRIENCHMDVQEMIINENSDLRDMSTHDEASQDPLEVDALKTVEVPEPPSIKAVDVTPTPRKRGRPRKIPLPEGSKPPTPPALPVTALEERPQRSLRLMRERPAISVKPRGRGRGRGARRIANSVATPRGASDDDSSETMIVIETIEDEEPLRSGTPQRPPTPEDPTSSRIKLPRMTEALDKSSACLTPLSSRRRSSSEMKLFGENSVSLESSMTDYMKSPEVKGIRGRGVRGRGTPRGRTPRGRGRGRGGGKGATYMKETMGIYGRVCGPATTTVELFEEETCMMDDNATPKPSHLLDEDSQSSVKSSTNESSSKMKKSKFADLFDNNKVWHAADVKEYTWPPRDVPNVDHQVMMIQEQVAMFLGVKGFKRRYPELRRRTVAGEEKDYCLSKGIVTEALCDLGATAVDASDVLDIMLSDYPHKYEEYRSYQREKQLTESLEEAQAKLEEKPTKIEMKVEKSDKPEPPKVDPEKTRQDMAAAAIASAAEWNTMANAWRRPACVDLQSNTIHRRRAPPTSAPIHCQPPMGFYPHAILPGQFQHHYRTYTPEQLRYFPLNTVIAAPPAPPSPVESSSESEGSWADSSSSSDDSHGPHHSAKRKKLTKVKRTSHLDKDKEDSRGPTEEVVDLCRVCKLRLEANRKYTHERFLVCAQCNAKLHPGCSELGADTIRKCREYPWQCSECKVCSSCSKPAEKDNALFCELCDRAHHLQCVSLTQPPQGRWHCVECSVCKSCGAREPCGLPAAAASGEPAEWHHQTKRGPGGHKVYSHSLCTPCARAYRIGRYCPLCERSFIGPKGTMQLVICKLCDRQLHQECVRPTVATLNVMDYTCAECRRGGITSRAGAVRAAPRTIATLFMAKRRFNKYAHRQYMQSRMKDAEPASERPEDAEPSDPETCDASDPLDGADSRMSE